MKEKSFAMIVFFSDSIHIHDQLFNYAEKGPVYV